MISNNPYYISGRKKFEAQDFKGAIDDYSKAIEAEENPSIYSERAVAWYYLEEKEKSLADMNYAANLEPENPYRYSSRAYIRDSMGDLEGAIEDYEKAVKLDPEDSIAYNNLGLLQEKLGYREKAQRSFHQADSLAGVKELLEQARIENASKGPTKTSEPACEDAGNSSEEREAISWLALIRTTLTTKSGFKEYLQFIRNGFRV